MRRSERLESLRVLNRNFPGALFVRSCANANPFKNTAAEGEAVDEAEVVALFETGQGVGDLAGALEDEAFAQAAREGDAGLLERIEFKGQVIEAQGAGEVTSNALKQIRNRDAGEGLVLYSLPEKEAAPAVG